MLGLVRGLRFIPSMWKKRFATPALVALLSSGFMSQSPVTEPTKRRIAAFDCVGCNEPGAPAIASPLPPQFAQYLLATGYSSSTDLYASFARSLEFQARNPSVNPILIAGSPAFFRPFGLLPTFPSYALPSIASFQVNLAKPDTSKQLFGGLMSDPALRHLLVPSSSQAAAAPVITVGTTLATQDLAATLGAGAESSPAASTPARPLTGDLVVPQKEDRLPNSPVSQSSSLTGSRPVRQVARPEVAFTVNGAPAPAGFARAPGSPAPAPVKISVPDQSPNPIRDAIVRHSFVK